MRVNAIPKFFRTNHQKFVGVGGVETNTFYKRRQSKKLKVRENEKTEARSRGEKGKKHKVSIRKATVCKKGTRRKQT